MKKHVGWNYAPYTPLFNHNGVIYICRIAPKKNEISFLCRTSMNGAHNFHDSNYSVFKKIKIDE